ncbi:Arm DNA-binding domain-containing protein [Paraburkholderia sediminicola]|uniref:Arm DNA-binding domain-containing protein n=1 Tax=Paraburkholderia sediminicola TaxID=458836 RepID=UPI0038BA557B
MEFDYRLDGKDCNYALGRFPDLSISDARQRRIDAARLVAFGIHPVAYEKQLQQQAIAHNRNTFRDFVFLPDFQC